MLTLALDTTTRAGSVAVMRDDVLLAVVAGDAARTHGERLPGEIARALEMAKIAPRDLQLAVVGSGPGAFTGLRIGLAAVQGLTLVLGMPVIGVSALEALALAASESTAASVSPIAAWMDAQRGEVFAALYIRAAAAPLRLHASGDALVGRPDIVLQQMRLATGAAPAFVGDGAVRYRDDIARAAGPGVVVLDPPAALAPFLARIGQVRAAQGEAGPPHLLQPLYVRRPDAEIERDRVG